jgi:predicted metal-dependent hydrolase
MSFDSQPVACSDQLLAQDTSFGSQPAAKSSVPPQWASGGNQVSEISPLYVRHRRARRYILRVLGDGRIRVTLPRWGTLREARAFAAANRTWIAKQRARQQSIRRDARSNALRPLVERWYRRKAERELPGMLMALAREHGVSVAGVSVRDQQSRWGACSSKGMITLNWRLIRVPAFVREYVLLHELMHRRELNHSRRFWRLMSACCPRHAEARGWLKREGKLLWSDCV